MTWGDLHGDVRVSVVFFVVFRHMACRKRTYPITRSVGHASLFSFPSSAWHFLGAALVLDTIRTALRFAENLGHEEVACILRVDPAVSTIQEAAAAGSVHEVWALMRQVRPVGMANLS